MIVETVDFYNGLIIYNVSAVEDISTWCVCESLQMRLLQESPDECSATKSELHTPWPAATDYLTDSIEQLLLSSAYTYYSLAFAVSRCAPPPYLCSVYLSDYRQASQDVA